MDVRNNSAWNQRYFVLKHTGFLPEVIDRELKYVLNRIQVVKNNESTWNFLRALLEHGTGKLEQHPEVIRVPFPPRLSHFKYCARRLDEVVDYFSGLHRCP